MIQTAPPTAHGAGTVRGESAPNSPSSDRHRRNSQKITDVSQSHDVRRRRSTRSSSVSARPRPQLQVKTSLSRPDLKSRVRSAPLVPGVKTPKPATWSANDKTPSGESFLKVRGQRRSDVVTGSRQADSPMSSSSEAEESAISPVRSRAHQLAAKSTDPSSPRPRTPQSPAYSAENASIKEISIGVLGASSVGKTTFIHKALDLRNAPTTRSSFRKMSIDGIVHVVRLLEMAFDEIYIGNDDSICWPDTIDDATTPRIDGVLVLYDVMNTKSLEKVPEILNALHKEALPNILVSCKCDNHPATRAVDPVQVEQKVRSFLGDISTLQTSGYSPETQQRCLSVTLRAIVNTRQEQLKFAAVRRRANSSSATRHMSRPISGNHVRASSEVSSVRFKSSATSPTPAEDEAKPKPRTRTKRSKTTSNTIGQSFLDLEASSGCDSAESERPTSSENHSMQRASANDGGPNFDKLVDRLLAQPFSKADTKFVAIFLALYRKFASPSQLLEAIIRRFESLDRKRSPMISKTIDQLRYLAILEQWISTYAGDFAYPSTRKRMQDFATSIASDRVFSVGASEILGHLEYVVEDDDTDWACSDRSQEIQDKSAEATTRLDKSSLMESSGDEDFSEAIKKLSMSQESSGPGFSTSTTRSSMTSHSIQVSMSSVDFAQRQAKSLVPFARVQLSKVQWHLLIGEPDESIAKEMTRIDWIMFTAIKPRDLVRYVTLSGEAKLKCKSLENVSRMIDHFNHVAHWVANFVLLRDKPKHRAIMLEKFMRVARKLREMNNYNSLGAIIAGVKGSAVHRLIATRECVTPSMTKDFMKLEILMGTQRSHFAYRLAWENSSAERIPYLPLLLRDLITATEANKTFVDEPNPAVTGAPGNNPSSTSKVKPTHINWRKFEIMGDVIVGVQRAQSAPYPNLPRNDEVRHWLLDLKIVKDDEEIYERSVQLESAPSQGDRRRFNWFKSGA